MNYQKTLGKLEDAGEITPMPKYQCHKKVWALKIKEIVPAPIPTIAELEAILNHPENENVDTSGATLIFEDKRFAPIPMGKKWVMKHEPQAGGYFVRYEDGYESFSPADVFESGYALV